MYVHLPTLARLGRATIDRKHFSPRRAAYTAAFGGLHAVLFSTSAVLQRIDDLRFPDVERVPYDPPVYIVATPRSGTTFFYNLLALDEARFTGLRLWHTVFPSISAYDSVTAGAALDARIGSPLGSWIERLEKRMFPAWESIHRVGLGQYEEDEALFVYPLLTPSLYLLFPFVDAAPWLGDVDHQVSAHAHAALVRHYRAAILRHVRATGVGRAPLVKTVLAGGRLGVLRGAFPEARFVHLVRHPAKAIPSAVSMFFALWQSHSPDIERRSPETRALARLFVEDYRRLCELPERLPPGRALTIRYEDLVRDPAGAVARVYETFGLSMGDSFSARLARALEQSRDHESRHRYSLDEFGLDEAELYRELRPWYERWGYEPAPSGDR